jgi:hypothetical protein
MTIKDIKDINDDDENIFDILQFDLSLKKKKKKKVIKSEENDIKEDLFIK